MMMASHHDELWTKLHELELQLAAYRLQRGEDADASFRATEATCRGRQYEAYMRRRDARRGAASAEHQPPVNANKKPQTSGTSRRDTGALPRSRTVNGGAGAGTTGTPARSHHQRRSSVGAPADVGDSGAATPRPFLRRGTGTGGAAAPARLRVHDLPSTDVPVTFTPRQPQLTERGHAHAHAHAARHVRSASELSFDTAARHVLSASELPSDTAAPQTTPARVRARKRWGSPERPVAMFSATPANSHGDFSQGLKKLLSFVRKGGKADVDPPCGKVPSTGGRNGKPVRKGWSRGVAACSLLDEPFDCASLDGNRFPTTRTVGISS